MENPILKNAETLILKGLVFLWGFWVLLEFLLHNPHVFEGVLSPAYGSLQLGLGLVIGGSCGFLWYKKRKRKDGILEIPFFGIIVPILTLISSLIILAAVLPNLTSIESGNMGSRLGYFGFFSSLMLLQLFFIVLTVYGLGHWVLNKFPYVYGSALPVLSIGLGFVLLGVVLFLIGAFGFLNMYVCWVLMGLLFLWRAKSNGRFAFDLLLKRKTIKLERVWPVALFLLLVIITAIYIIAATKPYPVGFDGNMVYLNQAGLVAEYGGLPLSESPYNWGLIMGLGQILFGQATISIYLSQLMSVLVLFALFVFLKRWLSANHALLAASVVYLIPAFRFHAHADEKTDLAFLFIAICSLTFVFLKNRKGAKTADWPIFGNKNYLNKWLLAGLLAGFAFGIKYTGILLIISLLGLAFHQKGKESVLAGYFTTVFGALFCFGIYRFAFLPLEASDAMIIGGVAITIGVLLMLKGVQWKYRELKKPALTFVALAATSFLVFAPWVGLNISRSDSISVQSMVSPEESGAELIFPFRQLDESKVESLVDSLSSIQNDPQQGIDSLRLERYKERTESQDTAPVEESELKKTTDELYEKGVYEELVRYLGYEEGLWRYTSLPFDITNKVNTNFIQGHYINIGFLFLLFLPLFLFSPPGSRWSILRNIGAFLAIAAWTVSNYYSTFGQKGIRTESAVGDQLKMGFSDPESGFGNILLSIYEPLLSVVMWFMNMLKSPLEFGAGLSFPMVLVAMLLLFGLLLYFLWPRLGKMESSFRTMVFFVLTFMFLWWLMGNGVVWYGFLLWALLPAVFVYNLHKPASFLGESNVKFARVFTGLVLGLYFLLGFNQHMTGIFDDRAKEDLFHWQMVNFATDPGVGKKEVLASYNPFFNEAIGYLNEDMDAKIFGVNTFFRYHIRENDRRLYNDAVLSRFDEIISKVRQDRNFINTLKKNGYKYILYDLRTAGIDQTAEQSLVHRCNRFVNLLLQSERVELLVTDNFIEDNEKGDKTVTLPNGKKYRIRASLTGDPVMPGSFALFRIGE
ncbi:MAG: hypothetical protein GYB31_02040 [Bacteroidetes bacterium]|nr:hypothetical protein [Bacteroidota bacterium]